MRLMRQMLYDAAGKETDKKAMLSIIYREFEMSNICIKTNSTLGYLRQNLYTYHKDVMGQLRKDWCIQF